MRKVKKNIEDILALTPMQEGMLFHYLKEPGSDLYFEQLSLRVLGNIDTGCFEQAWGNVTAANEMLRTVFRWEKMKNPTQVILKEYNVKFRYVDLSIEAPGEKDGRLERIKTKDREESFDLRDVPFRITLCKINEGESELIISNHHILYDGWSTGIILKEFFTAYTALVNKKVPLGKVKPAFKKFVQKSRDNTNKTGEEEFWKKFLQGFDTASELSIKKRTTKTTYTPGNYRLEIGKEVSDGLKHYAGNFKITTASIFYSAWGILLQKYNNSEDVVFGTSVSGRSAKIKGIEEMVGLFINTLPLRISRVRGRAGEGENAGDFLSRIHRTLQLREEYENASLTAIKEYSDMNTSEEMFDTLLVIENYPLDEQLKQENSTLTIDSYSVFEKTHYDLTVAIIPGDEITMVFYYREELFDNEVIERLAHHYTAIVKNLIKKPRQALTGVEMLSDAEKRQILFDFNNRDGGYPRDKTIHGLFEEQAERTPDTIAVSTAAAAVTYRRLNEQSHQLAQRLKYKNVEPGAVVGIMIERSIEMVIGISGILRSGAAYLPLDPRSPADRTRYQLENCKVSLLLTTRSLTGKGGRTGTWKGETYFIDTFILEKDNDNVSHPLSFTTHRSPGLAYIIFTSGSTGKPKGVPITHSNLSPLLHWGYRRLGIGTGDRTLHNLAYYFDWSVWEIFITLTTGAGLFVVPDEVLLDSRVCIAFMNKHGITVLHATPTQYGHLAGTGQKTGTLKYLFLGAEKLGFELAKRSFELVPHDCRVFNMYGPTEATIISSTLEIHRDRLDKFRELSGIPIGGPVGNAGLFVLDRYLNPCPVNIGGELYIAGDGVAAGYLNDPGLTAEKFSRGAAPSLTSAGTPGLTPFYRTGDLARWLPDGDIEFLGRIDFQVKVRGYRIELGEIENHILSHEDIREAVVVTKNDHRGDTFLCAYIVPYRPGSFDGTGLRSHLLEKLPGYMVPAHFMELTEIPLAVTGKVNRKALPEPEILSSETYVPPRDTVEKGLVEIWAEVLGIDEKKIGIRDNFFALGGHSLKATGLATRIHKKLDIEIPLSEIFKYPTVSALSLYMKGMRKSKQLQIELVEEKEYYPLSPVQERFFVFQQMEAGSISYNISDIMRLDGVVSKEAFENVARELIRRHESLRTSFKQVVGESVQKVHAAEDTPFEIEYYDITSRVPQTVGGGIPAEVWAVERSFVRPFDLSRPPLMRIALAKVAPEAYYLFFDMHHIVSDGVSMGIFIREFLALYNGEKLPPLTLRYKDYVNWRRTGKETGLERTSEQLGGHPAADLPEEVLNLPTDYVRPAVPTFEGEHVPFEIGEEEKDAVVALALEQDTTVYVLLLSAFNIFLSKLSGQENIVVGSPIFGRLHQDLEGLIGLFINTMVLRNFPLGERGFCEFLAEVKENFVNAFEIQEFQYEKLVDEVKIARETGRNPLFDVMFVLQNMEMPEIEFPGLKVTRCMKEEGSSKFDMTLYCEEYNNYLFRWEYSTALFKPETIRRFIRYFKKTLAEILADPHKKISEIDILSEEERQRILYGFNDTAVEYPRDKTIFQLFQEQAKRTPEHIAVTAASREPETTGAVTLTYRELDETTNRLAHFLRKCGITVNTAAGIMMERSAEVVVAVLSVLKAGGTYLPIDPEYPNKRIISMLTESGASFLLTTRGIVAERDLSSLSHSQEILALDEDQLIDRLRREPDAALEPISGPDDLIYIIFTSGSTGKPKGAGVYHRGFVNLLHWFVTEFGLDQNDRNLLSTSLSFDLTQKNLYASLITGGRLCIPEFNYFEPRTLLREIHENSVTWLNCTPSMFYELVEYETAAETKHLTLLRCVFLGGEPISISRLIHWLESEDCGAQIVNTYGPTECTDISNYYRITEPRRFLRETIPVGQAVYNVKLYIPDKNLHPLPVGVAGELLIGGAGVGIGYVNDRELTAKKFITHSFVPGEPGQMLYRTGDLVKWLPDGNVEFLGRIDHQVKIRGFRIELGEIESRLFNHQHVKEVLVMAREGDGGDRYLCAYIVPHTSVDLREPELREYLAVDLPDYMVPSYFIVMEKMPLNPNGKVDRKALPEPERTETKNYEPPRNEREKILVDIWADVLGVDGRRIGIYDDFFRLGGHSLKAAGLMGRIHKAFSVEIPIGELFKVPTVKGISGYIEKSAAGTYSPPVPVEEKEYYILSSAQKRLFFLHRMDPEAVTYNVPVIMKLEGIVERERFERAFKQLIRRHESLRTSFELIGETPVQKIHKTVEFELEYYGSGHEAQGTGVNFLRAFDLSLAPLLRVGLLKIGETGHRLMFDMHHIISDGISTEILLNDFMMLYAGENLPPLKLRYKDYSHWQNSRGASVLVKEQEKFWLKEMDGEIPVLELPTDFPRPPEKRSEGNSLSFDLGPDGSTLLRDFAAGTGTTPFMVLLAIFNLLLSKLSCQEDIIIGTPTAGRSHSDLQNIIGVFINTLALRNYPSGEKRFSRFLSEVKENCLKAFENQDYQYEELVEAVVSERDISRNSLFDVMLVLQNMDLHRLELPGLKAELLQWEQHTSKLDITLTAVEKKDGFDFSITYSTLLFNKGTIQRFINYFKSLLPLVVKESDAYISDIDILPEDEKRQLMVGFNAAGSEYPRDKTIHLLFEEQVRQTPDAVALYMSDRTNKTYMSYKELNRKSNQLARLLRTRGIIPDTIAGLLAAPSLEMIFGILAVLKAGGAYLPIDPLQPVERIAYVLADSRAVVLLTAGGLTTLSSFTGPVISIDNDALYTGDGTDLKRISGPAHAVYTIYTSGTTGKSKGALIENRNLVNYVSWFRETARLTGNDRGLLTSSFAFDLGYTAVYPSLLTGCQLHIIPRETYLSPEDLIDYIGSNRISYLKVTPSLFTTIVESAGFSSETCRRLRLVIMGGEEIKLKDVKKAHAVGPHIEVMNHYGPTEATIGCIVQFIDFSAFDDYIKRPVIGRPIHNMKVFILDKGQRPVPIGVPGELCVSGDGVARGYLNQPDLTAQRFNRSYNSYRTYKTGDLARWSPRGTVEFLGRIDTQVKIRGYRVELGEIKSRLMACKGIKDAVVIVKEFASGDKHLCAYIVVNPTGEELTYSQLIEYLSETLPDYMLPSFIITLKRIPLTSNGKLNLKLLPEPGPGSIDTKADFTLPRDSLEVTLGNLWHELLGVEIERIGIDRNFFRVGGHSLKAIMLVSGIHKTLDVKISLAEIFKTPTIRGLAAHIKKIKASGPGKDRYIPVGPVEEKEYYELSSPQKRLFILYQLEKSSTGYNMPRVLHLEGDLEKNRLEETFRGLIERHESLRTSFEMMGENPVQKIHKAVDFEIHYFEKCGGDPTGIISIIRSFIRPFDLSEAPLMRVGLIEQDVRKHILLLDMHHIISDAVSRDLFIKDFIAFYSGEVLPGLPLTYKDYARWQAGERESESIKRQEEFWVREFEDEIPVLDLPTDYPRPAVQGFEGNTLRFQLSRRESGALRALALEEHCTLYMVLLAIYNVFLSKISGLEDIVVGSPIAGRRHADLEQVMGMFVNTLALRNYPGGEKPFTVFLREVREKTLAALENQEYPFEDLVDNVVLNRDLGRNPLFDVMFLMGTTDIPKLEIPGLKLSLSEYETGISKFDLTLGCEETEENLVFHLEYSTRLFAPETAARFIDYFKKTVSTVLENPEQQVSEIDILAGPEKNRLLYEFNNTRKEYPRDKTIYRLFEEQIRRTPDGIALHMSHRTNRTNISYKELNRESNQLARLLRRRGLTANRAAGIMLERSVEMMVVILGILKAGGTYLPIDPEYPRNRIVSMLESSRASLLLTTLELAGQKSLHSPSRLSSLDILSVDDRRCMEQAGREAASDLEPLSGPDDLIYIIFTSGSTGRPKGAGVYHRGFMNLLHWFVTEFQLKPGDRNLLMTSLSFDLTQKNLYASLTTGGTLCLPEYNYFDPRALLETIHRNRITWLNCTPGMFYKLVEYETGGSKEHLRSLRYVFLGGEPVSMTMLIDWLESGGCRAEIVNTYGPTECTDISNFYRIKAPRRFLEDPIPVGGPIYNVQLYIPDKNLQLLPVGVGGELLIGGAGVGIGYVDDKELTARKFIEHSFVPGEPGQLLYRTGDLARWLPDGNVEFLGRIDHQVKIRGFRIEPGEIENRLLGHPDVKAAVVMPREGEGGDKYLCAYVVPHTKENFLEPELREYLESHLPGYMVPAYFVLLEKIPLTPNGKVDRNALPEPERTSTGGYVAPRNESEMRLVAIWSEVLGIESSRIGIEDNFFHLGGHSLKAVGLAGRIHKAFSVEIPITELFKTPTVKGISGYIEKSEARVYASLTPVEEKEYYPLSSAQKRLFFLYRLDPESITYNLPGVMKVQGNVETGRFERVFNRLIHRHESLRTSFDMHDESPVQKIHEDVAFKIEYYDSAGGSGRDITVGFIRPFDLSRAPLLRVALAETGENEYILMFDMHHIVSDGVSMGVLIKEFTAFYSEEPLPELQFQYKDFAYWQNRLFLSGKMSEQVAYWRGQFEGEIPVLTLPTDSPRPPVQQFAGAVLNFEIAPEETAGLKQLSLETGSTLYMVLFAVFNLFLSKLSGIEDIVAGTVAAGRSRYELENIIGMFVNTLPIRTHVPGMRPFPEFLSRVKENILAAFENQDYQYEELVETLVIERDLSRNPLFDVLFVLQNMDIRRVELPGLKLEPREYNTGTSKFDLSLQCVEGERSLEFIFEYSTALFDESTILRFTHYFRRLLSNVLEDKERYLYELELIPRDEKEKVLYHFNDTRTEYPSDKTIHRLFREQAARIPDRIAVVGMSPGGLHSLTYRELNEKSDRLAGQLRKKGVGRETLVGLMVERSLEMMVGILGILKAGGAYLPVSPDYPGERINHMLGDCDIDVLLLVSPFDRRTGFARERLFLDEPALYAPGAAVPAVESIGTPNDLAYVMYTSGSTGKSKGVMVEHRSVIRLVINAGYVELSRNTRILQTGAVVFDAVTFEMWGSLLNGGRLYLVPNDIILDVHKLGQALVENDINTLWLSAPLFNQLAGEDRTIFSTLEWLIVGGDVLSPATVNRVRRSNPALKMVNGYGPTENTTFSLCYSINRDFDSPIPIGKPIGNSTAYIVDKYDRPRPIGVFGELVVGGDGVSRGYLNSPGLTAEKFSRGAAPSLTSAGTPGLTPYPLPLTTSLYRTGDLARWLPDGNIEFAGRLDDQVKIRGFRVEPGEIESQLSGHDGVKEVAVTSGETETGDKYLCAYIVPRDRSKLSASLLREYMLTRLPDYMVPAYFMFLDDMPLNPNGKIDRKALPAPEVGASPGFVPPRDEMEEKLAGIWSDVLGIEAGKIGVHSDFFQMGGHSLKVISLISKIHETFDVKIPLAKVFETSTIGGLSNYIRGTSRDRHTPVPPAEKKEYYPLTPAQERLFVLHQLDSGGTGYNIPTAVVLEGDIHGEKLESVFNRLIHRHESLRTAFQMLEGRPVQFIPGRVDFKIEHYSTRRADAHPSSIIKNFIRPFDLARPPLLRVGQIELEAINTSRCILVMDMHHIVSDGASMDIFIKEFLSLFRGEKLPVPGIHYKDFSEWRNSEKERGALTCQEKYWLAEFGGEIPVSMLPTDFERPAVQRFEGSTLRFEISGENIRALKEYGLNKGATFYMVLLAVFNIFLSRLSGREEIVVGTPVAGRRHEDIRQLIGVFINTLALKNNPTGEKNFPEFLDRVKEKTLNAFENQDYPYEMLVEKVAVSRDASRNPLFDVMFALRGVSIAGVELPDLKLMPYPYESLTSKFDLSLFCIESEEGVSFAFEYSTGLFRKETVERFVRYFKTLANNVLEDPGRKISEIEILTSAEKNRLLYEFNDTRAEYPDDKTIHELFENQVEKTPHRIAAVAQSKESGHITVSYRALNEKSRQLAVELIEKGVKPDTVVGIMAERSIEMIAGILGILKAGGAYLPIEPGYPEKRINYMLKDSNAEVLIKYSCRDAIYRFCEQIGRRGAAPSITRSSNLAYVIYTSGSTGNPKGTVIEHRSLVNRLNWMQEKYPLSHRDTILQKTPFTFDVSVWELFWWAVTGARVCFLVPGGEKEPGVIAAAIETHNITVMHFVPSMLTVFLDHVETAGAVEKLSGLEQVFASGEALPLSRANHFNDLLYEANGTRLANLYGPTEATIDVSFFDCSTGASPDRIPIGKPIDNIQLYIVDKYFRPQPVGVAGELCISGVGVARGYLNRPELTAEKFYRSHKSYKTYKPHILYRTGDLTRWLPDGNIEFLGRLDFQVKIRGFRIELGEIENRLRMHDKIKEAVVTAVENNLCAYVVPDTPGAFEQFPSMSVELRDYLSRLLPDYMVPSYLVQLETLPLTPNGKIDRGALPPPGFEAGEEYVPPRDQIEEKLVALWSKVLDLEKEKIGIDHNFFRLGGHSLKAAAVVSGIYKEFNVNVPLARVFQTPAVRGLAEYIKSGVKDKYTAVTPAEKKEYYLLSSAQKRLYVLQQMADIGTGYNMPTVIELTGTIEKNRIEDTFKKLVYRHESLRTSFEMVEGTPVQKVHENAAFEIAYHGRGHGSSETAEEIIRHFVRPFDLMRAPLLRVGIIEIEEKRNILVVDMHHIVSDGISMGILVREFMALYSGRELAPPGIAIQYRDYSEWQIKQRGGLAVEKQAGYWKNLLGGDIPVVELPVDFVRPAVQGFEGGVLNAELDEAGTGALKTFALGEGITLYMLLLGIVNIFLSKISGREDVIVGTVTSGRSHPEFESVIGMFVNTLALRNRPGGETVLNAFLKGIRENTTAAFENQDYPFEDLLEQLPLDRDTGRNPLFDTMFVMQDPDVPELEIPGLTLGPFPYEGNRAKFDLTISGTESKGRLLLRFEYRTELFRAATVERFIRYFKRIASMVPGDGRIKLKEIEIISEAEKQRLLFDFNNTRREYPREKTIHRLFEEQVLQTPDRVALNGADGTNRNKSYKLHMTHMTYKILNQKANRLSRVLRQKGVVPDTVTGIMAEPSVGMIAGILGILKAGGAYLPIDPEYPEERNRFILKDSDVNLLLTTKSTMDKIEFKGEKIDLEDPEIYGGDFSSTVNAVEPGNLAYVIYTSGTTGNPKGVLIEHRNVVRLMVTDDYLFEFDSGDVWTMFHSYCFDFSVWEMYGALLYGGKLILLPRMIARDTRQYLELLAKEAVTVLNQTPTAFYHLAGQALKHSQPLSGLKYVIFGGEALKPANLEKWHRTYPAAKPVNMFGITETTVHVTYKEIEERDIRLNISNIGRSIPTLSTYVMDRHLNLVPPGAAGEICVGGEGPGRGYLNRPELTREKFVANPYIPGERMYRSGDLGRLCGEGELEYIGRIDQQVKIRGFRIELGEIEKMLLGRHDIDEAVVTTGEDANGDKYLCAYIAVDREYPVNELRDYLINRLPGHMVPSYFIPLEKIPLTASGKLDRKALPVPEVSVSSVFTAPRDETESKLAVIWEEELGVKRLGIHDNFFDAGGHSLKAVQVAGRIRSALGVEVPIHELFRFPTIAELSPLIRKRRMSRFPSIEPQPQRPHYELSYSQKRLWYIYKSEPGDTVYNMPDRLTLYDSVDVDVFRKVLEKLTERHEGLRTCFKEINMEPVQVIEPSHRVRLNFEVLDWSGLPTAERESRRSRLLSEEYTHVFALDRAPLFRVRLIKCAAGEYDLVFNMHHIISDGLSLEILKQEFNRLYDAGKQGIDSEPGPLKLQYKDYAAWQNRLLLDKKQMERANEFWREQLSGELPLLNLPYDFPPGPGGKDSAGYRIVVPGDLAQRLREMAAEQGGSLFMVLLAGFNILLRQVIGQKDIVVGIPAAARRHEAFKNVIGMFVNTLILRNRIIDDETFVDFFKRLRTNTFNVLEYQDVPLELICGQLGIKYPEISVFFNMVNTGGTHRETLKNLDAYHMENVQGAKFDIVCYLTEYKNGIEINCHYFKERFKPETAEKLMNLYAKVLDNITAGPGKKILEYSFRGKKRKLRPRK